MQEKVEIITNHIVHFWTILDKNTQKRILCIERMLVFDKKHITKKIVNLVDCTNDSINVEFTHLYEHKPKSA